VAETNGPSLGRIGQARELAAVLLVAGEPAGATIAAAFAESLHRRLNLVFEAIVGRCSSLRGSGKLCGRSIMWIWRQLRQNKSFDLCKVAEALTKLEVPLRFFFEEVIDALPGLDPAWVLRHLHRGGGPLDPFLAAAQERLEPLLALPAVPAAIPRRHREIDALGAKRLIDPGWAKAELELLAADLIATAEASGGRALGVDRGILADCARLFLAWSAAQSSLGRRDDGIEACVLACRMAEATGDSQARGIFYLHGSRLLSDLKRSGQALRFVQAACGVLQRERKRGPLAEALVQKSIVLAGLQQDREARIEAIAALRLAARTDWRIRATAWLQLAELAVSRRDYRRALARLGRAKKNALPGHLKATIKWREARVLDGLGRVLEANLAFRSAIGTFERQKRPLEAARIAVDHLEMSLKHGRSQDVLARLKASSPHFEQLGCQSRAFELWMDLCALFMADGPRARPLAQVAAVRRALEKISPGPSGTMAVR
jgi:tetratricopeptide (TPR) repeat protein